ncbi:MAG: winged helix-turn-helix domain-containing protein [Candidatus Thermoplasmatota archaeon]|nr:winged helix-turn-helix domain-containing protein [Candidatus Thermoplasmatota archaeon]
MTKVTLDREAFKALASDTRLEILRTLDGKKMSLTEISRATKLNKATLHEHLSKLLEADLVKRKERDGHKWVYYRLSWKGESLLHPENTKIVVMFSIAFMTLAVGLIQMFLYAKGTIQNRFDTYRSNDGMLAGTLDVNETVPSIPDSTEILNKGVYVFNGGGEEIQVLYQDPLFLYVAIVCISVCIVLLLVAIWRLWKNKNPKL